MYVTIHKAVNTFFSDNLPNNWKETRLTFPKTLELNANLLISTDMLLRKGLYIFLTGIILQSQRTGCLPSKQFRLCLPVEKKLLENKYFLHAVKLVCNDYMVGREVADVFSLLYAIFIAIMFIPNCHFSALQRLSPAL